MTDLFWNAVSSTLSNMVLGGIGTLLAVSLFVGYFPLLKWFPVIGQYVQVARLASIVLAALFCFLIGYRASSERCEARTLKAQLLAKQMDLEAAQEATARADKQRSELAEEARQDRERIKAYAEQLKARPNGACILTPDDFSGRVRNHKRAN
ncbi:hypothetical protein [Bradyrhizobium cenepequi]